MVSGEVDDGRTDRLCIKLRKPNVKKGVYAASLRLVLQNHHKQQKQRLRQRQRKSRHRTMAEADRV